MSVDAGEPRGMALDSGPAATAWTAPNWPLLLLVFVIPLQNIYIGRIPRLGGGLNLINVLLLAAIAVWFMRRELSASTPTPLRAPIYGYAMMLIASTVYGIVTIGHLGENHLQALKDVLIPLLLFFATLGSVRDRRGIVWVIVATLLPLPYMFRVFRNQLGNVFSWHYDDDLRLVTGTFSLLGSNEIAAFYAGYTFVLVGLVLFVRNLWARLALAGLALMNLYCLLYAYSRGSWLAFLASMLVVLWVWNRKIALLALALGALSYGTLVATLPVSVQERFETIFVDKDAGEERDASAASRFALAEIAVEQFKRSPIWGIGFHAFHHVNPLEGKDTHNYYLKVLAEQGILGLAFLLLIFWRAGWLSLRLFRTGNDPVYKALGLGAVGLVVAFAVGNLFGDRFSHYPLVAYFWVYLALVQRALTLALGAPGHVPEPASLVTRRD